MAVFGMESSCIGAPDALWQCGTVCMDHASQDDSPPCLFIFHGIRSGDLVFIKSYSPQAGLDLKAVGVVRSGSRLERERSVCIPVEWVWQGERHLSDPDDQCYFRGNPIYEEYNLAVQREIMDLLPAAIQLPLP